MRNLPAIMTRPKNIFRLSVLAAVLCGLWVMPLRSNAKLLVRPTTSVTITNNSNWEIHHVYFSPVDSDEWGPDQLGEGGVLHTGQSATLSVSCGQSQIKVISEDKDGCFLYHTVSCSASAEWAISNDAAPDCGN